MATYNKFQQFVEDLAHGVHNLSTNQLELALTNAANAPVATNSVLANLTTIAYTNLNSPFNLTTSSSTQTGGTYDLVLNDFTISATGTAAGFRYVVVWNDDPTSPADPLICWFDYGSDLVLNNGESLTVDFESDGPTTGSLFTLA
jgi:hypothetical protein